MHKIILSLMIFTSPIAAQAAGFALVEQSGSGLGNAFAGAAAAEDASTIFFNPAGMTYIQGTQLVSAIHLIKPTVAFNDGGLSTTGGGLQKNGNGGDAGDLALLPNLYFKTDLSDRVKLGLGVNAPFGLKTEYNSNWIGRFQTVKSALKTVNINPAIAYKVNDNLSIGAGISAMWAQAELTNAQYFGAAGEGSAKVKGDDWGFGFNLGAIYQVSPDTRLGVAYRSKVEQHLVGNVNFARPSPVPNAGAARDGNILADLTLPETFSVNAFSRINDTWDLMGDVTWTRWSQLQALTIYRDSGSLLSATQENWSNTLRYSVGANYHYSDAIKLRAGLAYDKEAISDQFRTARIPGNDRKWLSLGAGWKISPNGNVDVGYAHLFINNASINRDEGVTKGKLIGNFDGSVDIVSMQYTHNF
ncbi:MAG: outer membrane protein transport protein [Betaproteobacteria bacterium]